MLKKVGPTFISICITASIIYDACLLCGSDYSNNHRFMYRSADVEKVSRNRWKDGQKEGSSDLFNPYLYLG